MNAKADCSYSNAGISTAKDAICMTLPACHIVQLHWQTLTCLAIRRCDKLSRLSAAVCYQNWATHKTSTPFGREQPAPRHQDMARLPFCFYRRVAARGGNVGRMCAPTCNADGRATSGFSAQVGKRGRRRWLGARRQRSARPYGVVRAAELRLIRSTTVRLQIGSDPCLAPCLPPLFASC
jgi:hypothetical protein